MVEPKTPSARKPDLSFKLQIKNMPTMKFEDDKSNNLIEDKQTAFVENLDALLDEQKKQNEKLNRSLSLISYNTSLQDSNLSNQSSSGEEDKSSEKSKNNNNNNEKSSALQKDDYQKSNAQSMYGNQNGNYTRIIDTIPPNPLLPKNFGRNASPQHGGGFRLIKLMKFRGIDNGKSLFTDNEQVDQVIFAQNTTLKQIFQTTGAPPEGIVPTSIPIKDADGEAQYPDLTEFGQIVYVRDVLDFSMKKNFMGRRDYVLEENLLDVRRLLKDSQVAIATQTVAETKKTQLKINIPKNYYTRRDDKDITLIFESRFESGNLAAACKVNDYDYHLLLQNDVNTGGHTQWFFFKAENVTKGQYRFNILNLCKPDSLYNEGMKVLCYSERKAQEKNIGWYRAGTKISYYQNNIRKEQNKNYYKSYYTHTFTYEFEYECDKVFFAYCYPYTYTDCIEDLNRISNDPAIAQFCTRKTLCETLAGNKCEILTITSRKNWDNFSKRKGVVMTARVHPGESVGSWMMKGALDFLTDPNNPEAELLRQNYVFKVLPMLNPDGVINGNYRCSLAGCDLNRRWKAPSKVLHPTIYYTKQMIHKFSKERELAIFCDFHGHSRRKNIFMYGCNRPDSPEDTRLFPFLMGAICPHFIYSDSRFGNQKSKESTARMSLFNELKQHPAIYTMESSFCGNNTGQYAKYHFSTENLSQTGKDFCRALLLYGNISAPPEVLNTYIQNINSIYYHNKRENETLMKSEQDPDVEAMKLYEEKMKVFKDEKEQIQTKHVRKALLTVLRQHDDVMSDLESTSSAGSDNFPSEDNLQPEEMAEVVPIQEDPNLQKQLLMRSKTTKINKRQSNSIQPMKKDKNEPARFMRKNSMKEEIPGKDTIKIKDLSENGTTIKTPKAQASRNGFAIKSSVTKDIDSTPTGDNMKVQVESEEVNKTKKKLRKNIESKDACTQTDRSDYMLIKQRQVERQNYMAAQARAEHEQQFIAAANSNSGKPPLVGKQKSFQMRIPGGLIQINQEISENSPSKQNRIQRYTNTQQKTLSQAFSNSETLQQQVASKDSKQKLTVAQTMTVVEDQQTQQANKRRKSAEKTYQVRNISSSYNQHAMRMKSQASKSGSNGQQQTASAQQQQLNEGGSAQKSNFNQPIDLIKSSWEQAIANSSVTNSAISQWIMKKNKEKEKESTANARQGNAQVTKKYKYYSSFNIKSSDNLKNENYEKIVVAQRQQAMSPSNQNKAHNRVIQSLRSKQTKNTNNSKGPRTEEKRPHTSNNPSVTDDQSPIYAQNTPQYPHTQPNTFSQTVANYNKRNNLQKNTNELIQSQNNILSLLPTEKIEDSFPQKTAWSTHQKKQPIASVKRRQISFPDQNQQQNCETPQKKIKGMSQKQDKIEKISKTVPSNKISSKFSNYDSSTKAAATAISPNLDVGFSDFYQATQAYQEQMQMKDQVLESSYIKESLDEEELKICPNPQRQLQEAIEDDESGQNLITRSQSSQRVINQGSNQLSTQKEQNSIGNTIQKDTGKNHHHRARQFRKIQNNASNQGHNSKSQKKQKGPQSGNNDLMQGGTGQNTFRPTVSSSVSPDKVLSKTMFKPTGNAVKKGRLASLGGSGQLNTNEQPENSTQNQQQFIHVQRIVPSHQTYYQQNNPPNSSNIGQGSNKNKEKDKDNGSVKIQIVKIVNVHNEYNIQNNFIVQGGAQAESTENAANTRQSSTKKKTKPSQHPNSASKSHVNKAPLAPKKQTQQYMI